MFKLVTNAQGSKIFISNVTTIKIKCSNNFPLKYSVEITYTNLEKSENFAIIYTPPKTVSNTAVSAREDS